VQRRTTLLMEASVVTTTNTVHHPRPATLLSVTASDR
jgi:hypothetical protein